MTSGPAAETSRLRKKSANLFPEPQALQYITREGEKESENKSLAHDSSDMRRRSHFASLVLSLSYAGITANYVRCSQVEWRSCLRVMIEITKNDGNGNRNQIRDE